jgi:uncharacterized protein (TIGR03790 family)
MKTPICKGFFFALFFLTCAVNSLLSAQPGARISSATSLHYEIITPTGGPTVLLPSKSIQAEHLGILVNDNDSISDSIAHYYALRRGIPLQNILHVSLPTQEGISKNDFDLAMADINTALQGREHDIQAFVLAWKEPNKFYGPANPGTAAKSSLCAAFAKGEALLNPGSNSADHYFYNPLRSNNTTLPYSDFGIRPSMHLMTGTHNLSSVKEMIDRGISADASFPGGDGYFIKTGDLDRNIRYSSMTRIPSDYSALNLQALDLSEEEMDYLHHRPNVLFYFTGDEVIKDLNTNSYLPGSICDHLTSSGGNISNNSQTFVGEWIDAGVTASYGTVSEPTASSSKFPYVPHLVKRYYQGGSVLDAYWHAVSDPSQAYFVGEALARPYKPLVHFQNAVLSIQTTLFDLDRYYLIEEAPSAQGPWNSILPPLISSTYKLHQVNIPQASSGSFYRITPDYLPPSAPSNLSSRYVLDSLILPCSSKVAFCELNFSPSTDNTGEIAAYRLLVDGKLLKMNNTGENRFRVIYDPGIIQKKANELKLIAIDKNGNESLAATYYAALPGYRAFGCFSGNEGDVFQRLSNNVNTSIHETEEGLFQLEQNAPNPFREKTTICFSLRKEGKIKFSVFRIDGQLLYQQDITSTAGKNVIEWDGRDFFGEPLPRGLYLYQVQQGKYSQSKKMLVQ